MADDTNRPEDAALEASLSVLGDDSGGDPKVASTGGTPPPAPGTDAPSSGENVGERSETHRHDRS